MPAKDIGCRKLQSDCLLAGVDDFRIRRDPLNLIDVMSFDWITQDNPHDAAHSITEKRLRLVGRVAAVCGPALLGNTIP